MSWRKVKRRPADIEFSKFIRIRDGWICQRCKKQFPENAPNLHNSHFHSRAKESTRFSPENCDAICAFCHEYFGGNPNDYVDWKKKQLGTKQFNLLLIQANTYKKKDDVIIRLYIKELMKEL